MLSAATNFTEQAHVFGSHALVGVLNVPEQAPETAVIIVVGGPQYRAGSHRQFVLQCRALAQQGIAAFRFDYTGMGDSPGALTTFLSASNDIALAVNLVCQQLPSVQRIALWGLCDGASAALLYWHETRDPRVQGLCLLNPWVRSAASHAQTQVKHYYTQRLMQAAFWRKLLTGKVAAGAVAELTRQLRAMWQSDGTNSSARASSAKDAPFQTRMAQAWHAFPGKILLVLSGNDYTAKEFLQSVGTAQAWRNALEHAGLQRIDLPDADHTFSEAASRLQVEQATLAWVKQI